MGDAVCPASGTWRRGPALSHERLRWTPPPPPRGRQLPELFRDPIRTAAVVGAVAAILGALLPFMRVWTPGVGWFDVSGFARAGDGGWVFEIAIVAASWRGVIAPGTATSRPSSRGRPSSVPGHSPSCATSTRTGRRTLTGSTTAAAMGRSPSGSGSRSPVPPCCCSPASRLSGRPEPASRSDRERGPRPRLRPRSGPRPGASAGSSSRPSSRHCSCDGATVATTSTVVVFVSIILLAVGAWLGAMIAAGAVRSLRPR